MSRSYKKMAGYVDSNSWAKRLANRRFRRTTLDYASGNAYRKHTCPYDICDWRFLSFSVRDVTTWHWINNEEEAKKEYARQKRK